VKNLSGQVLIVGTAVLQPYGEQGEVAAPHQLTGLEVGSHGLVVLVLHDKAVPVSQPGRT
jgi:hypothetical protein